MDFIFIDRFIYLTTAFKRDRRRSNKEKIRESSRYRTEQYTYICISMFRVSHYSSWIQKTMEYLDNDYKVSLDSDIVEDTADEVRNKHIHSEA